MAEDYTPMSKIPEAVDLETEQKIRNTVVESLKANNSSDSEIAELTVDNIMLGKYCGYYNGFYVVQSWCDIWGYPAVEVQLEIDGIVFAYSYGHHVTLWREK